MLEVSRRYRFNGMFLNHDIQSLNKSTDAPINVPGIMLNGGFSSGLSEEFRITKKKFSLPSFGERQHDKRVDQKRHIGNGDLLLQWGQRKRMRIAKGAAENPSTNTTPDLPGNHSAPASDGLDLERQVSSASPDLNWPAKVSIIIAEGRNGGSEIPSTITSTFARNMASYSDENPSNSSDDSHKSKKDFTMPVRKKEKDGNNSLESTPATDPKSNPKQVRWLKITLSLSRKEKEEDFLALKGGKPPHRPKKRSKQAEKALQYLSPGAWLPHLTRDRYEVKERKPLKQGPRGLKEMDSMGNDWD